MPPVPELQGKAKNSNQPANPVVSGTSGPNQKAVHAERPISKVYPVIDNDLARDTSKTIFPPLTCKIYDLHKAPW
jgi:hypothetical protein